LPRHWQWLPNNRRRFVVQSKLVERAHGTVAARPHAAGAGVGVSIPVGTVRPARFRDAARKLFANDRAGFSERLQNWPEDVRYSRDEACRTCLRRDGIGSSLKGQAALRGPRVFLSKTVATGVAITVSIASNGYFARTQRKAHGI
jgi:hypothetical protein